MSVTRDATSGVYFPASATEAAALFTGVGAPFALYQFQESAGPFIDSISGVNLANNGMTPQTAVGGWSRFGISSINGGGAFADNLSASWPDLNTTSQTVLLLLSITAIPAGSRTAFALGGVSAGNLFVNYDTSGFFELTDQTNTGVGSINHGTGVIPVLLRYNLTASTTALFVGYTGAEKISKTFSQPAAGNHGFGIGDFEFTNPAMNVLGAVAWQGSAAEMTDAQIIGVLGALVSGPPSAGSEIGISIGASIGASIGIGIGV